MLGELVVEVGAGRRQVDVLEPVGEGPGRAWSSGDGEGSRARGLNGRGHLLQLVPGARRVHLCLLEYLRAVPNCGFGRRSEPDSVQSVLEAAQVAPDRRVVLGHQGTGYIVDGPQNVAAREVLKQPGLGEDGDIRRAVVLDAGFKVMRQIAGRIGVGEDDAGAGALLEMLQDL